MNFIKTVAVIVFDNDKVLLVEHQKGAKHLNDTWGLPAGKIDNGETEIETAVRELQEETGLVTSQANLKLLPTTYSASIKQKDAVKNFEMRVFVCDSYQGELANSEETVPQWVTMDELHTLNLLPNVQEAIDEAMGHKKYV